MMLAGHINRMLSKFHLISLQQDTAIVKFLTLIVLILVASFFIDFLLSRSVLGKSYRIFVAPGVIIHELSHAFVCLFTGAKMTRISFFEKDGGSVEHHPSKLPIFGPVAISIAPFVFGAVIIYFLSKKLGIEGTNLAAVDITKEGVAGFFRAALANLNFGDPKTSIIVYLVLSIAVTMTPSWQDLRNMIGSLIMVGIGGFLIVRFTSLNLSNLSVPPQAFVLLSTVFLLLLLALILSIIVFALSKAIKT